MNSMNRTSTSWSRPKRARSTISSSLTPRSTTALILTGSEPGFLRRLDAVEHADQLVTPGHLHEPLGAQRVEADVDSIEAGQAQLVGHQPERRSVGGQGQVGRPTCERRRRSRRTRRCQLGDQHREVGAHRRLATGEPDPVDARSARRRSAPAARSPRTSARRCAAPRPCPLPACSRCSESCSDR